MTKLIPLALAATALTVAGCQTPPQTGGPSQPPRLVTTVHPYYAGNGTVQNVYPAPAASAATGSSAEPMRRLEIKMDNGQMQYVDTTSSEFAKGTRVSLTDDKIIRKM